jgi:pimeloyl-ACP methyl ester carboxylesterase
MVWLLWLACASKSRMELAASYALDGAEARAVVPTTVFVPGVLGSQLEDPSGVLYWGSVFGSSPQPHRDPDDFRALALPVADAPLSRLDDELEPGGMLLAVEVDTKIGSMTVRGYPGVFEGLLGHIADEEARRPGRVTVKEVEQGILPIVAFGYDWRHDLSVEVARLHEVVLRAAAARQAAGGEAKVDLIGHSMGGLLVRYYLRYGPAPLPEDGSPPKLTWEGAKHVSQAILVAPPNGGSPMVLASLLGGEKVSTFMPRYPSALVGSFPSLYQMLPRPAAAAVVRAGDGGAIDLYDVDVWDRYGWGLLDPDEADHLAWLLPDVADADARRAVAKAFLARALARAEQLHEAIDRPATPPPHLKLHLFAGDSRATPAKMEVVDADGSWKLTDVEPGDGRVTRRSAIQDERDPANPARRLVSPLPWDTVHLSNGEHFSITRDPQFLDNALYLLLQAP